VIRLRRSTERGHFDHGWLETRHTFSFGDYHDPAHMGFRSLRVLNEDRVRPGKGFPTHSHRDMEIVTWVLDGALEHRDSLGNGSVIRPGEAQRLSAGTGITHSEFNHSASEPLHFLQIWILPVARGLPPGYEQKSFAEAERRGRLRLVGSPDGRDGSVTVRQDADLFATLLSAGQSVSHVLRPDRHAWVHVARGDVALGKDVLESGDAAASSGEPGLEISARTDSEILLFDLA
jgi:redox-sensitive bicupin YhaK (pirin superfamily)